MKNKLLITTFHYFFLLTKKKYRKFNIVETNNKMTYTFISLNKT